MTHRRTCLAALSVAALALTGAGCSGDDPSPSAPISGTTSAAPSPSASATPTPSATATSTSKPSATPNAPLNCPDVVAVSTATGGALNEQTAVSPTLCGYRRPGGSYSGSIQSEDSLGSKSLKAYRATMLSAAGKIEGITTEVEDRADFAPGAFLVTITGDTSGPISSLIVARPGGKFASISVSRSKKQSFTSDLELTEALARVFLEQAG